MNKVWLMIMFTSTFLFCLATCIIDYTQDKRLDKLEHQNQPLPIITNLPALDLSPYYLLKEKPITIPGLDSFASI